MNDQHPNPPPRITLERSAAEQRPIGVWQVTSAALSQTINRYLPDNAAGLRSIVEDRVGEAIDPNATVADLLVMLADMDHNVDSDPLRAY